MLLQRHTSSSEGGRKKSSLKPSSLDLGHPPQPSVAAVSEAGGRAGDSLDLPPPPLDRSKSSVIKWANDGHDDDDEGEGENMAGVMGGSEEK